MTQVSPIELETLDASWNRLETSPEWQALTSQQKVFVSV